LSNRGLLAIGLAIVGAVMLFLGWYGVSGRPNLAEQMPYIASGTIPGAALVVAAAVMLTGEHAQRTSDQTRSMMAELHSLLVEAAAAPIDIDVDTDSGLSSQGIAIAERESDDIVAVPGGTHFHRATCALAAGKPGMHSVGPAGIEHESLAPCPMCEPTPPP
jgi:hypothetical protein